MIPRKMIKAGLVIKPDPEHGWSKWYIRSVVGPGMIYMITEIRPEGRAILRRINGGASTILVGSAYVGSIEKRWVIVSVSLCPMDEVENENGNIN